MKYYIYGYILLLLSSCSTTNEKHEALNDYLETIEKNSNKEIFIAREKINSNYTLEIFKLNEIQAIDSTGNITPDTHLFNEKDWRKFNIKNPDQPIEKEKI
jgi:PHP family Zn ribbon phosphoesterase